MRCFNCSAITLESLLLSEAEMQDSQWLRSIPHIIICLKFISL